MGFTLIENDILDRAILYSTDFDEVTSSVLGKRFLSLACFPVEINDKSAACTTDLIEGYMCVM